MSESVMKPGKNGYRICFTNNTVVMNYKFSQLAGQYGTKENDIIRSIRQDFPGLTEIVVSGREQKSPRPNTRLTYANMEKHISTYENAQELLEAFETVKAMSAPLASPYKYVADWFRNQFPNYRTAPVFNDHKLTIAPVEPPQVREYKQKMPKAG